MAAVAMRLYVDFFRLARLDLGSQPVRIGVAVTDCDVTPSHQTLADTSLRFVGERPDWIEETLAPRNR